MKGGTSLANTGRYLGSVVETRSKASRLATEVGQNNASYNVHFERTPLGAPLSVGPV